MKKSSMKITKYCSIKIGTLPKGCQMCVKGEKLVLFITGLCPRKCNFCPISDNKHEKDIIYANEWQIKKEDEILKEAELMSAKGAGITGGDPLVKIKRTVSSIKKLKKKFGKKFHIHLYTSFNLVSKNKLESLYDAGLDEIRFHPDIDNSELWNKIDIANEFDWDIGIEVPVIPKKFLKYKKIIDFFKNKIDFINLNELEIPDNDFHTINLKTKNNLSYGAKGSDELAVKILEYIEKINSEKRKRKQLKRKKEKNQNNKDNNFLNAHFCTTTTKDRYQLGNRIKRRSKQVALPTDKVDSEGLLHRGVIYLKELYPQSNYKKKIEQLSAKKKKELEKKLKNKTKLILKNRSNTNRKKEYHMDIEKIRLITSVKNAKKLSKDRKIQDLGLKIAIVKEYPTHDQLEIEIEFI